VTLFVRMSKVASPYPTTPANTSGGVAVAEGENFGSPASGSTTGGWTNVDVEVMVGPHTRVHPDVRALRLQGNESVNGVPLMVSRQQMGDDFPTPSRLSQAPIPYWLEQRHFQQQQRPVHLHTQDRCFCASGNRDKVLSCLFRPILLRLWRMRSRQLSPLLAKPRDLCRRLCYFR
jgi:hypothetical protein